MAYIEPPAVSDILPCPNCTEEGVSWARVYATGKSRLNYYCPTCKTIFALEELALAGAVL